MARARVISALALLFVLAIATVVAADESCDATRGSCAADAAPEESPRGRREIARASRSCCG